jgi:uncharacterized protein DUF4214
MATSEQINDLVALYAGYFNRAPDPAGLQFWIDQIDGGREFNTIAADFASSSEATALYPYLTAPDVASPSTFITSIYQNLFNRAPDQAGLDFWSGVLAAESVSVADMIEAIINGAVDAPDATPPTFDKTTLDNKVEVGLDFAVDAGNTPGFEFDAAAKSAAVDAIDDVTNDPATVAAAKAETDAFLSGTANLGDTFTLTTGLDAAVGTEDNDTFIGLRDGTANTFTLGDDIDGSGGTDTLRLVTDQDGADLSIASLTSIENFELRSSGNIGNVNLAGNEFSKVVIDGRGNEQTLDATIGEIANGSEITIKNADFDNQDLDINVAEGTDPVAVTVRLANIDDADVNIELDDAGDGSSDDDTVSVILDGVKNTDGDMDVYAQDAETFNVTVVSNSEVENIGVYYNNDGSDFGPAVVNLTANADLVVSNFWDLSDTSGVTTTFNITGSGNVSIAEFDDGSSDVTLDGSTATGDLELLEIDDNFLSVTTGTGADTVEVEGTTTDVSTGSGNDKVILATAFALNATSDAFAQVLDGGDGMDTFEIDTSDLVTSQGLLNADVTDFSDAIVNFERLSLTAVAGQSIDATTLGFDDVIIDGYTTGGDLTVETDATVTATDDGTTDYAIIVEDAATGTADSLNLVVEGEDGIALNDLTVADVETINLTSAATDADETTPGANTVDLIADGTATLNISGETELVMGATTSLTDIETVNAASFDAGLEIDLSSAGQAVTITTGAGADIVVGSDFADTINVGNGGNTVTGGLAGDDITIGSGVAEGDVDTIVYTAVAESQGVNVDTITGFQVAVQSTDDVDTDGDVDADDIINDILDFSGVVATGTSSYAGEANGYGAVLTTLQAGGTDSLAVLDTSTNTLYWDVNADGQLDNNDMAIELAGVTDLSADNFAFV